MLSKATHWLTDGSLQLEHVLVHQVHAAAGHQAQQAASKTAGTANKGFTAGESIGAGFPSDEPDKVQDKVGCCIWHAAQS